MDYLTLNGIKLNPLNAGIAFGTTTTTNVAAATSCIIGGKFTTAIGSSATTATPTLDSNTGVAFQTIPVNYGAALVFGSTAAGALVAVQGPLVATLAGATTVAGGWITDPQFPPIPDDFCPIAYTVIRASPTLTGGFIVGSTQWTASGATCLTPVNIATLPERPKIA